jgi:hypothetical protein
MNHVEYRIERVPLNRDEPRLLARVERRADLGRQGWHVASLDLTPQATRQERPLTVLLEREAVPGDAAGPGRAP